MLGFIHDIDGSRSSKRLIAFVAMGCVTTTAVAATFGYVVIPEYMFNGLKDLVLFGLGAIFGERLTPQRKGPS